MGVGGLVVRQAVVIDQAAQVADVEGGKQLPFLRRVEQGEGTPRLVKGDLLYVSGGVEAVPPVRYRVSVSVMAGREQEYRPQAHQENRVFYAVHI